ncbi:hypothetical protein I4U23_028699 [Adineta vaga]|nr:hypothetical protein I4U23_028699 [Adineta vaga]
MFLFIILHLRLSKENMSIKRRYTALLINSEQMIEMTIPIDKYVEKLVDPYSIAIESETIHPYDEAEETYYQSILLNNDLSYFPAHETVFESCSKFISKKITDVKKGVVSNKDQINFI